MSSENPSTVKSSMDKATGLAQRTMGTVTGSSSTQKQGEETLQQGKEEDLASHTTAKLGPFTADPNTGATAKDDPNRATGSWDQTIGSAKESLGNMLGNENLRRAGVEQNAAGKETEAKGQLTDWGKGMQDRAQGAMASVGAAVKGDREEEQKWRDVHDEGKVRQRGAEVDMQKKGGN